MTRQNLALLIDGDNISPDLFPRILATLHPSAVPAIRRVYGNAQGNSGWTTLPGLKFIHSGTGKNATDLLICIEALDLLWHNRVEGIALATSDGDFSHLALYLRERNIPCICIGPETLSQRLRACSSHSEVLRTGVNTPPPPVQDPVVDTVSKIIAAEGGQMLLHLLNPKVRAHRPDFRIADHDGTWRKWLARHPGRFAILGTGAATYVRTVP